MAEFYLDENVKRDLVGALRLLGHSARTATDEGLLGARDEAQVLFAAERQWILVTHNIKDFVLLHDAWLTWSNAWGIVVRHGGIIIAPDRSPAVLATMIDELVATEQILGNVLVQWKSGSWVRRF